MLSKLVEVRTADKVIIAVGGRASRLPIPGAELGMTYEDVRGLAQLPSRVCVIGAADTGCQLASIFADFGAKVWLVVTSLRRYALSSLRCLSATPAPAAS